MWGTLLLRRAARQLDTLTKELTGPLSRYVKGFPHPSRLHPFERALLELTLGEARYCLAVERVDTLRKAMLEVRDDPEADVVVGKPGVLAGCAALGKLQSSDALESAS